MITSGTNPQKVQDTIIKYIRYLNNEGRGVLIITQIAFERLDMNLFDNTWNIITDEIPTVDNFLALAVPFNSHMLKEYFTVGQKINSTQYVLELKSQKQCYAFVNRWEDSIDAVYKPLVQQILDGNQVIVDAGGWDRVMEDYWIDLEKRSLCESYTLYFLIFKTPVLWTPFKKTIMMGANFQSSMLYTLWNDYYGVNFVQEKQISSKLQFTAHPNGHRLVVTYLQERAYSRHQADQIDANGLTNAENNIELAHKFLGDNNVLCALNKDDEKFKPEEWRQISVKSHGSNSYMDYHKIYFGAALNRHPKHNTMLSAFGIPNYIIEDSFQNEIAYQVICRTSIRSLTSQDTIEVVVQDKRSAEYIAARFPGCTIGLISGGKKKVVGLTPTERKWKKKTELLKDQYKLAVQMAMEENGCVIDLDELDESGEIIDKTALNLALHKALRKGDVTSPYVLNINLFADLFTNKAESGKTGLCEFVDVLSQWQTNYRIGQKDQNVLFNEGGFVDGIRKKANFQYSSLVILDIDGGELPPDEFRKIFEHEKISHCAMNSFSNGVDGEMRYRAIFFLDKPAVPEVHAMAHDYLTEILKQHHYYTCPLGEKDKPFMKKMKLLDEKAKLSGVDASKRNGYSIFYAPCTRIGYEEHAFFYRAFTNERDLKYHTLKVDNLIKHSHKNERKMKIQYDEPVETQEITKKPLEQQPAYKKAIELLSEMTSGNRSINAVRIGGLMRYWETKEKWNMIHRLESAGCSKTAIRQAKIYAKLITS